jgi:hypothetical protein
LSKLLKNVFLTGPALLSWLSFSQGKGFVGSRNLLNQIDCPDVLMNLTGHRQCIAWMYQIDPINKTPWNNLELFPTLRNVVLIVVLARKGVWVGRLAERT